jgi:hypothetical protein
VAGEVPVIRNWGQSLIIGDEGFIGDPAKQFQLRLAMDKVGRNVNEVKREKK